VEVLVDEGDAVTEDQVLARLDTAGLLAARRELDAQREEIEARLALARLTLERTRILAGQDTVSKQQYDEARFEEMALSARLASARAEIERADIDLGDAELRSPFAGRIVARSIDGGTILAAGQDVLRLIESGRMEARVGVAPGVAAELTPGARYTVVSRRLGDRPEHGVMPGIPLSALSRMELVPEVSGISRYNGERSNTVQAFLSPYTLIAESLADFRRRFAASDFVLPDGYRMEIGGENEQRSEAIGNLMLFALPLLVLMAGTIILSFNSFRFAAVIGSVAVLSIGLAMLGVWLFGYPLGFLAVVGTMGLVGLAINGGIVVLAALRANPEAMQADPEATREVVVGATRHILGTTLTTVGGFVPLILFGGRFWPPMATAIAGGVGGSAILSLYLVPSLFMLIVRRRERVPMTERTEARADATPLAAASNPV
jgi:biotin carboxyl carrier protein